ncbi:Rossmann fold nucleotide-binding protein Smf possibly involved in DNA uptake [hydrothermal vent metagenome]|uniref:Rossmann fold nucleotide-binding protein Smf possibly involved in DNA uptake n=1 Tax=hydrothermal vent metagenome TaxID=652676 RepID=A0A3B0YKK4_9ZZZZ
MDALSSDELNNRLRLVRCNLPPRTLFQLLEKLLCCEAIFSATQAQLQACALNPAQIKRIQAAGSDADSERDLQRDRAWLNSHNHGILFYDRPGYPPQLLEISDPPYALFYIGDTDYLLQPQLAMVGSRTPTAAGTQTAENFAQHLSAKGITITSGLAHGIDAASHRGALKGIGGSIAVVANGLHTIYPKANTQLAEAISNNGCIISESAVGISPQKSLFPRRNRIISGLSMGTLVTEAAINSGSLITTRHAMEQGKEIFAIPGSIHNPLAKGCHRLIKAGAKLVETAEDILEELFPLVNSSSISHTSGSEPEQPSENNAPKQAENTQEELDNSYHILLKTMEYEPVAIDDLVERSNLSVSEIASMLLILELQGEVVSQNGLYSRTANNRAS